MKCIGFGSFEGKCENQAGAIHSPYWCQRCDDLRIEQISKRIEQISKRFDELTAYGNDCPGGKCEM